MPIPVPNAFETASFAANLPAANSAFLPRLLYNTISFYFYNITTKHNYFLTIFIISLTASSRPVKTALEIIECPILNSCI